MSNKRSLEQSSQSDPAPPPTTTTATTAATTTATANQSKKVKFVKAPPTDQKQKNKLSSTFEPIDQASDLNFDELNQVGKIRRGRVRTEGYDSDSSTENTQVRTDKKKSKHDDDIFADEDQDHQLDPNLNSKFEKIDVGLKIKKGAEAKDYLDLGDIEGQEFGEEDDEEEEGSQTSRRKQRQKREGGGSAGEDYSDEEEDFVPGDEFANADDAPRARRKSKKGMGFLLSKFNMAEELEEGRMAADGSYVPSAKDPEAVHDNWLEGVNTKKTIKQAREAKRRREEQLRNQVEKDQALSSLRTRKDCYIELLGLLPAGDGRSVSQIICQLGNIKRALETTNQSNNKKKKKKIIQKKSAIDDLVPDSIILDNDNNHVNVSSNHTNPNESSKKIDQPGGEEDEVEQVKLDKTINEITDLASTLMGSHGDLDIYDLTHGSIVGILKSEGLVPRDWTAPSNQYLENIIQTQPTTEKNTSNTTRKTLITRPSTTTTTGTGTGSGTGSNNEGSIYYKFIDSDHHHTVNSDQVFGPFDTFTMKAWANQGFFGNNFHRILVKFDHSPAGNAPWGSWNQIIHD